MCFGVRGTITMNFFFIYKTHETPKFLKNIFHVYILFLQIPKKVKKWFLTTFRKEQNKHYMFGLIFYNT